ncbi:MAG: class I SAM-dependent methyltransferase [Spirochaetales bacterium]|nr:class I SAM-dependent methyltransferase [Spirochaetales bacterium]
MTSEKVSLNGVQETLLLPLWGRARETKKKKPLLIDDTAVRIIESIGYDFSVIKEKVNPISCASWIARSIYFDNKIKSFLRKYPDGSIINIGCGLDTTYERVNNKRAVWYELDFPEVIEIRKRYLKETLNRRFLPYSVFNNEWYVEIKEKKRVFIMIAGVIYYFEEKQVKELFDKITDEFEYSEIAFDYSSPVGVKIANKKVIEDGGMDKNAYLKWGIANIREMEEWNKKITVLQNMKMFKEHKKRYPLTKRLGMIISDALSIMSLAHITIE